MATLILHVGMHKTGSSSIQETLARMPGDAGLHVVRLSTSSNPAGVIRNGFSKGRRGTRPDFASRKRARVLVRRVLAACADRDAVLSAEAFETLTADEFADFMRFVRHDTVRIISYVREPYGFVSSAMQQRIKGRPAFVTLQPVFAGYRRTLEKFEGFPFEMVPFDRTLLRNGCVVEDFMARIGHPVEPERVVRVNEGLSRTAVALLFMRNRWRAANGLPPQSATPLQDLLAGVAGPKFRLHPEMIEGFLRHPRSSLAWAVERLGADWVKPTEPSPTDVAADADLLVVPETAHEWLAAHDATYVRTDDPAEIGAAVDRIQDRVAATTEQGRPRRRSADAGEATSPGGRGVLAGNTAAADAVTPDADSAAGPS